jgi:polyisoprenoid-binding protein YceI
MFARIIPLVVSSAILATSPAFAADDKATVAAAPVPMKAAPAAAEAPKAPTVSTDIATAPAGNYVLEKSHASITFKVRHMGFADYVMRFNDFDAAIALDPKIPEKSSVKATINAASLDANNPKLTEHVSTKDFLNVPTFPTITFTSTKIEKTGLNTGKIYGDLNLLGVVKPIVLDTTFIGGGEHMMMKKYDIGFKATTTLKRSEFGMNYGIGMVGDEVAVEINAEFIQQPAQVEKSKQ